MIVVMIPGFNVQGLLPKGIHWAVWAELNTRFGTNPHRQRLLGGLNLVIGVLRTAGCKAIYVDGSFVTDKAFPNDYDACWDIVGVNPYLLDPILISFDGVSRTLVKMKYLGDLFPAQVPVGTTGKVFMEFFQIDKLTGNDKGIVALKL